jgi:hypothetical protein
MCSNLRINQLKEKKEKEEQILSLVQPEELERDMCCGSGCSPCIMETYYEQLEEYEK